MICHALYFGVLAEWKKEKLFFTAFFFKRLKNSAVLLKRCGHYQNHDMEPDFYQVLKLRASL